MQSSLKYTYQMPLRYSFIGRYIKANEGSAESSNGLTALFRGLFSVEMFLLFWYNGCEQVNLGMHNIGLLAPKKEKRRACVCGTDGRTHCHLPAPVRMGAPWNHDEDDPLMQSLGKESRQCSKPSKNTASSWRS